MANVILILQIIISVFTVGIAIASFVFTILKNRVIGPKIDITEVSILDPWNKKTETIDNLVSLNGEELGESNYDCSIMLTIMNTGDRGTNISLRGMFAKFDSVEHSISDIEPLVPLNIYIDKSQIKTQEFSISVPDSYFPWLYGSLNIILCFWTHKRKFYEIHWEFHGFSIDLQKDNNPTNWYASFRNKRRLKHGDALDKKYGDMEQKGRIIQKFLQKLRDSERKLSKYRRKTSNLLQYRTKIDSIIKDSENNSDKIKKRLLGEGIPQEIYEDWVNLKAILSI